MSGKPSFLVVPFLVKALLVAVLVTLACLWPARAMWGEEATEAVLWAGAVAWVGAALGRLPRLVLRADTPDAPVHRAMAGIGTRLLGTAGVAAAVVLSRTAAPMPFGLALVVGYLALLVLETVEAVAEVRRTEPAREGAAVR